MFGFYTVKEIEKKVRGLKYTETRTKTVKKTVKDGKRTKTVFVPEKEEVTRGVRISGVKQAGKWTEIQLNTGTKIKIKNF